MNRPDAKVALISGAARGIGGETGQLMAKAGVKVVIADAKSAALEFGRKGYRARSGTASALINVACMAGATLGGVPGRCVCAVPWR